MAIIVIFPQVKFYVWYFRALNGIEAIQSWSLPLLVNIRDLNTIIRIAILWWKHLLYCILDLVQGEVGICICCHFKLTMTFMFSMVFFGMMSYIRVSFRSKIVPTLKTQALQRHLDSDAVDFRGGNRFAE